MRLDWLVPDRPGIPVLMYHRVWPGLRDGLTITPEELRKQWIWLIGCGYTPLSLQQFLSIQKGEAMVPDHAVLLTFDDGYRNNLTYVYPLLQELKWMATLFVIAGTLDGSYPQAKDELNQYLTADELRTMDAKYMQLALHGYRHEDFSKIPFQEAKNALTAAMAAFDRSGLPYHKVLGWPYGARPKGSAAKALNKWMQSEGIGAAFRIGNKPADAPAKDLYGIHRIDIRGDDSLDDFKMKLRKGKLKPF